jgi:hypothetical protein
MHNANRCLTAGVLALALVAGGCNKQPSETEQKLAEMQKQLDEAKKQLEGQAGAAKAGTKAAAQDREMTKDLASQQTQLQESAKQAVEQQKQVNAEQAALNEKLQKQIEDAKPVEVTIPAGTVVTVRTTNAVSTKSAANGSLFEASLEKDLTVDGKVLAPKGADVVGVVVNSDPGGRVKGVASLTVAIRSITGAKGTPIKIQTGTHVTTAKSTVKKDALKTGIMSGVGAAVGAIAGGGRGAAIGAGVGAGAGVGTTMATRGEAAQIPAETVLQFKLTAPSTVIVSK